MRLASRNLFWLYHLKSNISTGILVVQAGSYALGFFRVLCVHCSYIFCAMAIKKYGGPRCQGTKSETPQLENQNVRNEGTASGVTPTSAPLKIGGVGRRAELVTVSG